MFVILTAQCEGRVRMYNIKRNKICKTWSFQDFAYNLDAKNIILGSSPPPKYSSRTLKCNQTGFRLKMFTT